VALQHNQKICYNNVNGAPMKPSMPMLLPGLTDSAAQWLK
jgi:hypothetical protein